MFEYERNIDNKITVKYPIYQVYEAKVVKLVCRLGHVFGILKFFYRKLNICSKKEKHNIVYFSQKKKMFSIKILNITEFISNE